MTPVRSLFGYNDVVTKAYRALAKKWHSDRYRDQPNAERATKAFAALGHAYEVISDGRYLIGWGRRVCDDIRHAQSTRLLTYFAERRPEGEKRVAAPRRGHSILEAPFSFKLITKKEIPCAFYRY